MASNTTLESTGTSSVAVTTTTTTTTTTIPAIPTGAYYMKVSSGFTIPDVDGKYLGLSFASDDDEKKRFWFLEPGTFDRTYARQLSHNADKTITMMDDFGVTVYARTIDYLESTLMFGADTYTSDGGAIVFLDSCPGLPLTEPDSYVLTYNSRSTARHFAYDFGENYVRHVTYDFGPAITIIMVRVPGQ